METTNLVEIVDNAFNNVQGNEFLETNGIYTIDTMVKPLITLVGIKELTPQQQLSLIDEDGISIGDSHKENIEITAYLSSVVDYIDEDSGEVMKAVLLKLLCKSGKIYYTFSRTAIRSFNNVVTIMGLAKPIKATVDIVKKGVKVNIKFKLQ
jgi:hypothetical protein